MTADRRFVVDTNVLIAATKVGLMSALTSATDWLVTEEVADELGIDREHVRARVRPSPPHGSDEACFSSALATGQHEWKRLGLGEAASIAAAVHEPSLVFVTWDRLASWRALHELNGRIWVGHA